MFIYVQATGNMYHLGVHVGKGYSGNGFGLNNPNYQQKIGVGPIPVGKYLIGPEHKPIGHLGPLALPLIPYPTNKMYGRMGFLIHGDNSHMNFTASNGCIILGKDNRKSININLDKELVVLATEKEYQATLPPHLTS